MKTVTRTCLGQIQQHVCLLTVAPRGRNPATWHTLKSFMNCTERLVLRTVTTAQDTSTTNIEIHYQSQWRHEPKPGHRNFVPLCTCCWHLSETSVNAVCIRWPQEMPSFGIGHKTCHPLELATRHVIPWNTRFPKITGEDNLTVFSYSGRVKSPEWRRQRRRTDLRQF